ncbi:tRNA pseudouridine synthase [Rhizopus microsporus ATCC 52813]|uniref:tRNA pseudouridine synthase n=1 Tax=Rhizopus microsporus ATCC 52813 TaxID=1340429 RepID=A0A2G4T7Y3_RHIZD|nr:tRNA pseudouridine synthase [Rhizopus microsporus ATCC 52813]PHZ17135.1 tRNA pseudouridine synthase [Rhizopus microsporus ATCC 52813]
MESKYSDCTREQLLERIAELEGQLNKTETDDSELKHKKTKKRDKQRPFDMSKYTKRKIALRVAYIGWNYIGFASQQDPERVPTIEDMLFKALKECRLIEQIDDSVDYTRCGRTDKGVSGLGQVIALWVRSKKLASDPSPGLLPPEEELAYAETINRVLPDDIRVLAWAPVPDDFSARYHCTSRTYKYFFSRGSMDINRMRQACQYFEGEHDFRNFCKMDPSKNIVSYSRLILSMKINPVQHTDTKSVGHGTDFYEVELKGTAFLWHQVRYMMSVLFLVGQGLEPPETVRDLLDIEKVPSKPDFPMASDLPLVLYDCEFKDLEWHYAFKDTVYETFPPTMRTYLHFNEAWNMQMIRTLTYQYYLTRVGSFPAVMSDKSVKTIADLMSERKPKRADGTVVVPLGAGKETRMTKYKPVLERPRCDTDETKKEKYQIRKKRKLDTQEEMT